MKGRRTTKHNLYQFPFFCLYDANTFFQFGRCLACALSIHEKNFFVRIKYFLWHVNSPRFTNIILLKPQLEWYTTSQKLPANIELHDAGTRVEVFNAWVSTKMLCFVFVLSKVLAADWFCGFLLNYFATIFLNCYDQNKVCTVFYLHIRINKSANGF